MLLERPGELTLEHRTPARAHPLATVMVSDERDTPPLEEQFTVLRRAPELAVEREQLDAWLAAPPEGEVLWIQFAFPRVYKLYDATIFNSNTQFEALLGYGAKDVTIETSVDGAEWTVFADVELARAAETTLDMAGIGAKFVRLMINSNWGGMFPDSGLAEVAFTYVPAQARLIAPANGATGVSPAAVLETYADIAQAGYADSLMTARALSDAVDALIAAPSPETLAAARAVLFAQLVNDPGGEPTRDAAWRDARGVWTSPSRTRY